MAQIPTPEKKWSQPGDGTGNLQASFGIDLFPKRGRLQVSPQVIKAFNEDDDGQLDNPVAKFLEYNSRVWAIADSLFFTSAETDPTSGWQEDETVDTTSVFYADAVIFKNLLLYSQSTDIRQISGTTDSSYWQTALGQSALTADANRRFLEVGLRDGDLFLTNAGNLIHRVDVANNTVTLASAAYPDNAGTLDFSGRPLTISAMKSSSSRMWIGFEHNSGGESYIAEWDMGSGSIAPNRMHPIGATKVECIAIWEDTPIAILSNGKVKYFNDGSFVDWPNAQFPVFQTGKSLSDDFIHPNGWAIIDGLPHFLIRGSTKASGGFSEGINNDWKMPAGIYCLDPQVGLYNRFPVGAGTTTQLDYGQPSLRKVGALYSTEVSTTKFLASFQYYEDSSTSKATIVYNDRTNTKATRGWFATEALENMEDVFEYIKVLHRKLESGEQINIYYRYDDVNDYPVVLSGAWADTTHFHTTDTATVVSDGDLLMVKAGPGAGHMSKITKETSSGTTVLTLAEANSLAAANDTGAVDVLNFKKIKSITSTSRDWDKIDFPSITKSRQVELLVELRQNAGSTMRLDYVIIK